MHIDALAPTPHPHAGLPAFAGQPAAQDGPDAAPHDGQRTPDEAQEVLARDWFACERQAILMGGFGVW